MSRFSKLLPSLFVVWGVLSAAQLACKGTPPTQVIPVTQWIPVTQVISVPVAVTVPVTSVPATQPMPGVILFALPTNPNALNPVLGWEPGKLGNQYVLSQETNVLTLEAGPDTNQWASITTAPLISYRFRGNFEAEIKVVCDLRQRVQLAGLGVRSPEDKNSWVRIARTYDYFTGQTLLTFTDQRGESAGLNYVAYSDTTVYLKIAREDVRYTLSYSRDGNTWSILQGVFSFEIPAEAEIFLTTYSNQNPHGSLAQFSNFRVVQR